tara:strand:- start:14344 stop:14517 length:174 start_codon:yes stop_codon:yes gene_type:complete
MCKILKKTAGNQELMARKINEKARNHQFLPLPLALDSPSVFSIKIEGLDVLKRSKNS